ncbi:hypothetical protein QMK19_03665 [Streptomyces sp. H10-C2]|uniref:SU10 major capsid protein n=1 Tax=unclassified Streptomyces TaxID=2593676 RepID=UPI0024BAB831|nr:MULTISPECIES: hypothetical protein [unclassified Streptomyces]MDJ0342285.1 hypothetical protein [Streptomyces sp. PH10-H1]MDJ0368799.1 hypothetical protein [Streptomyces sp. H10-C2]
MPTELQEAITTAGAVSPLIPKSIDPLLLEYQRRYAPLLLAIPTRQWNSTQYFFNRRVSRPDSGGVVDGGGRPIGNSTYEQALFNIRLFQAVGAVTGFAQAVTRDVVGDLRQIELDGTVTSMMYTLENAFIWGNDGATAAGQYPICSGLDYLVSNWTAGTGSSNFVNAVDINGNFSLHYLDQLIDLVETNAAMPIGSQYMLVMSPRMASAVSQAFVAQQRFAAPTTMLGGGLNVPTYRDIPIVKSSFLSPRTNVMGTVTTATATTLGTLAAATYYYRVSAVVARFGEISASTEVSQVTTGATSTVTLSFSTPGSLPDGATPILYKVYRSTATTTETLVGTVDAFDTTGVAVTSIIDNGTNLLTNSLANTGPVAYQGTNTGALPRNVANAQEDIYLVPRDPNFLVRPYVRDMTILPLAPTVTSPDSLPFAVLTDSTLAIRAPKYVGRLSRLTAAL